MRIARLVGCGAATLLLLGSARPLPLHGQVPQTASPQSTFRATTALVEVDVIVLDRQGRFVPGLVADDLTLLEDGKPQTIQQFYMVTHGNGASAMAATSVPFPTDGLTPDRARRVFVLMFDESSLSNESLFRVKFGAEAFIREQMGPGDVGGVFVNGTMYRGRLTTDKAELLSAVRSVRPAFDNRQSLLAPFREFPRIPGEIDAVRIESGGYQVIEELGVQACRDDPFLCQDAGGLQQVENQIQKKARLYVRQARVLTNQTLHNLQYVASGLSRIPGRKTVVLMSEGFFVEESRDVLQTIAAQASRGGTTIYSLDGRGNVATSSPNPDVVKAQMARAETFDTGADGPAILTVGTGGLVVHGIDDMSRAFGMIARDTSTYYVIGYQPTNSVMDGKFRKIEVKPHVSGLDVRSRKGYLAVNLPPLLAIKSGGH
jgi:VWFA-related protein